MERPDGYQGLAKTYGLKFAAPPRIMELGLLYRALKEKQVDLVAGSATDGLIAAMDLVVLEDDRHYFPRYDALLVRHEDSPLHHPGLLEAVEPKPDHFSTHQKEPKELPSASWKRQHAAGWLGKSFL